MNKTTKLIVKVIFLLSLTVLSVLWLVFDWASFLVATVVVSGATLGLDKLAKDV